MILMTLVGEQPIPNLIPLWQDDRFDAVQFVASATTLPQAEMLANVVQTDPDLKHLEVLNHVAIDAYDIGKARARLASVLSNRMEQDRPVTLNLTGGTKIMSLAALQASFGTGVPLLYVSTEQGQLIHLRSDGSETNREPIRINIDVEQYLHAHGLDVSDNLAFKQLTGEKPYCPPKEGDWLEELVEGKARESGFFDDVRRNVFIRKQTPAGDARNELDVVVTLNGQLAVCSCKTSANLDKEEIYELAALSRRESAGIYCGKVLVSSMKQMPANLVERARSLGVKLVCGDEVDRVALYIRNALQPGTGRK